MSGAMRRHSHARQDSSRGEEARQRGDAQRTSLHAETGAAGYSIMYDLHSHILPGVDDGANTLDDAIEMARVAAASGTRVMLATPHRKDVTENLSISYVQSRLNDLNGEMEKGDIELQLLMGMENHLDPELPAELLGGRALPINGSRYALVELPFFGSPNYVDEVLFQLQLQGVTPVLAHPERIEMIQRDPERLAGFVERGMLSQITAGSIVRHFGGPVKRFAHRLLRRGLVHVIASDTHYPRGPRSPVLSPGAEAAARIVGLESAQAMVVDTPKAILEDLPVEVGPPMKVEGPRRWWRLWGS